jgi:hypothetical protein
LDGMEKNGTFILFCAFIPAFSRKISTMILEKKDPPAKGEGIRLMEVTF